jgi:hypothetical protein
MAFPGSVVSLKGDRCSEETDYYNVRTWLATNYVASAIHGPRETPQSGKKGAEYCQPSSALIAGSSYFRRLNLIAEEDTKPSPKTLIFV